jgi:hypothetical protein
LPDQGVADTSFVVFNDVRQGYGILSQLARIMADIEPVPLACFCLGDIMTNPGNEVEWVNFWRYARPVTDKMPFYLARGNHEGNDPASELVLRQQYSFPGTNFYYSVRSENILFIVLDTQIKGQEASIAGDQLDWMITQLDTASVSDKIRYIFIMMHQPLYPQGLHKNQNLVNADELHRLFLGYIKIRAVFAGHDHIFNYFPKDGINYIEVGSSGAPIYHGYGGDYYHFIKLSVFNDQDRINVKTIGIFHEIIEDFDI